MSAHPPGPRPVNTGGSSPESRSDRTVWTTRGLLTWMTTALESQGIESPRLCAELLLAHVVGCERLRLYMDADRPATELERQMLRELVARALRNEPVQYLVGEAWFFSLAFGVDSRVLIPRPSSETIVEHVLQQVRVDPALGAGGTLTFADICTGSGCLAVALLKNLPKARAIATDLDAAALEVALENARRHGVGDRIDLVNGDLLEPLGTRPGGGQLDVLVANPPYIPDDEWTDVGPNVKDFEPETALRGGIDGLDFVRPLIQGAGEHLRSGGLLLVEIASASAAEVMDLARSQSDLAEARIEDDFEGKARVLVARRR